MNEKETQKVQLDDLLNPKPPKKRSRIMESFFDKMTDDEKIQWRKQAQQKRSETLAKRRAAKASVQEQAQALLPRLMAEELLAENMDNPNWTPRQETIEKLKGLMLKGISIEEMRSKHFRSIKDENWHKITKFLFKSSTANAESMGLEVRVAFESSLKTLHARVSAIKREIRIYKKEKDVKLIPAYLLQMLHESEDKILSITESMAKTLHQVGAVGEKSKAPVLHVHVATPRPKAEEKPVEAIEV